MTSDEEEAEDENQSDGSSGEGRPFQSVSKDVPTLLAEIETAPSILSEIETSPSLLAELSTAAAVFDETDTSLLTELDTTASILSEMETNLAFHSELGTAASILSEMETNLAFHSELGTAASILSEMETNLAFHSELGTTASILSEMETSPSLLAELSTAAAVFDETDTSLLTELDTTASILSEMETNPAFHSELGTAASVLSEMKTTPMVLSGFETRFSSSDSRLLSATTPEISQPIDEAEKGEDSEIAAEINSFLRKAQFQFGYKRTYESLEAYGSQINNSVLIFIGSQILQFSSILVVGPPGLVLYLMGSALATYHVYSSNNEETESE